MADDRIEADYVIVGGGSAGLVLANRLSADAKARVLLLEAGGEASSLFVQLPVGAAQLLNNPRFDWCYAQAPDASLAGRALIWANGKLLGGGSSINGQVYIRGTAADYDRWAAAGATGWAFEDVLPYFLKAEDWRGPPSPWHGRGGPMTVTPIRDPDPLTRVFLDSCAEIGLPIRADYDGGVQEGAFYTEANQRDGWRCSTEKAYLRPARSRKNLTVVTEAYAERLDITEGRASGVVFRAAGQSRYVTAAREVIVTAGAIGSPAFLMRSGLGPAARLKEAGVAVVRDIAGVGENLQEHAFLGQVKSVNQPTLNSRFNLAGMAEAGLRFAFGRKGPLAAPLVQAMALVRTRDGLTEPDIQLHFVPFIYFIDPTKQSGMRAVLPKEPGVVIGASVCHPHSRGRVFIDDQGRPCVASDLLGDQRDVETLVGGMKVAERVFNAPSFAGVVTGDRQPRRRYDNDADWERFVRTKSALTCHPSGTCRMGSDPASVVDTALRLRGVSGVRVADASVMPLIPSTNTNAPTIMIAEKAAALIAAG